VSAKRGWSWVWAVGLGCLLAGLAVLWALWPQEAGPPPGKPLRITVAANEVPPPSPEKPPPAVAPLPAPVKPAAEPRPPPADEPPEPQLDDLSSTRGVERPQPPPLRRKDAGIAPKRITRTTTGRSAGKGVTNLVLMATYQGQKVSAPVVIDGVWRGNTPLAVTIKAGSHAIRVDHGRTRVNEFVTNVEGGRSINMEVELRSPAEARGNGPSKWGKPHHH
jgi:PEGA domain-containing protein